MPARADRHTLPIGGNLTRAPSEERIEFLAKVRNAALEPLWLETSENVGNSSSWFGRSRSQKLWPADKIVFLNDVYFCARDVVRLILHNVDMACGMDFDRRKLDQVPIQVYTQLCARFQEWLVAALLEAT